MTRQEYLHGKRVRIVATSNQFAQDKVGKAGLVLGDSPMLGMVIVQIDGMTGQENEYWALTSNLTEIS